jgi:hypothetical protein
VTRSTAVAFSDSVRTRMFTDDFASHLDEQLLSSYFYGLRIEKASTSQNETLSLCGSVEWMYHESSLSLYPYVSFYVTWKMPGFTFEAINSINTLAFSTGSRKKLGKHAVQVYSSFARYFWLSDSYYEYTRVIRMFHNGLLWSHVPNYLDIQRSNYLNYYYWQ